MNSKIILQYIFPIVAILSAIIEAYIDANSKKQITHALSGLVRVCIAFAISFWMFGINRQYFYLIDYTLILLVFYWIVFDPMYNLFKGVTGAWYIGKTDWIDLLARKFIGKSGRTYMAFKFVVLFVLFLGYVWND